MGLGRHILQHVGNSAMACGAVVLILGFELLEELGDVYAVAIREVPGFVVLGIVATNIPHDCGKALQHVLRVRPHRHPMHAELATDGDHALACRTGSSNSVYLGVVRGVLARLLGRPGRQVVLGRVLRLIADAEFRLTHAELSGSNLCHVFGLSPPAAT